MNAREPKRLRKSFCRRLSGVLVGVSLTSICLLGTTHEGQVRFGEVPVPGAVVRAIQGERTVQTVTDANGKYSLPDLGDGTWTLQVEMPGFETVRREAVNGTADEAVQWDLKMIPVENMKKNASIGFPDTPPSPTLQISSPTEEAVDRLLINGSVNNGASTPFALSNAFGNNRRNIRSLYTWNLFFTGNNSVLNARPYSLTGQDTPQPPYNRLQSSVTVGGPFQIPSMFRNGNFVVTYSRTQNRNVGLQTAQVPTPSQRLGDFSGAPSAIIDPSAGLAFPSNLIPADRISPQAVALLNLYPLPNFNGSARYNYQIATAGVTHGDNVQAAINNLVIRNADRLTINFGFQSTRSDNPDLFGFTDRGNALATNATLNWNHRFTPRVSASIRYQFRRGVTETLPYFGLRQDVSGDAGITGNDRDPRNWGPPALSFSSGIARLSSGSYAFDRDQSHTVSYSSTFIRGRQAFGYGADFRRQQFNLLSQQNARGVFTFTGAATGNDFADFLLSIPTASSLAYGNADKYYRQSVYSAYFTDDWRVRANLTLTLGGRWEYESPMTERYGRLVNLDIAPAFQSATPVVAGSSNASLIAPDKRGFEPRLGLAWRPRPTSSLIVRAGYGVYRDTNVYRSIADQMAQQSPISKSLSVQNTPEYPLSLADGFRTSPSVSATTFAVDPRFRVGSAQNWQLSIQHDLPQAMQMTITYLGIKGTHVPQRTLPNTYPEGGIDPCVGCQTGFVYLASNGSSTRNAVTIEVRRRQRNGFQASAQYTLAKAIDDAGLGTSHIAQNWLDLRSERGLSSFDQRHQLSGQLQYTTGMRAGIGGFWDGWRGKAFKEWTLSSQVTLGTGSPLTPVFLAPVSGTGITGVLRPDVTTAPLYTSSGHPNAAAFAEPVSGQWGNAGRSAIIGPRQFALNASLTRTFRVNERVSMDLRIDSTNVLNHVTYPDWNMTVNSSQFGLPSRANSMRTLQPSLRIRF